MCASSGIKYVLTMATYSGEIKDQTAAENHSQELAEGALEAGEEEARNEITITGDAKTLNESFS